MFSTLSKRLISAVPVTRRFSALRYQSTNAQSSVMTLMGGLKSKSKFKSQVDDLELYQITTQDPLRKSNSIGEDPRQGLSLKRTGPIAGRVVSVHKNDLNTAFKRLRGVISANNIKGEKMAQRFYKKPGKVLEEKQIRRKKRVFNEGVRRLMEVVKEAKRRGY